MIQVHSADRRTQLEGGDVYPREFDPVRGDELLAATLRGERVAWPAAWRAPAVLDRAMARIVYHGIAGLLVEQLDSGSVWPPELCAAIRAQAIDQAKWELRHQTELRRILDALAPENIPALFLKGTAIAYDLYRQPSMRARGDSDLLVRRSDSERTRAVLERLGYTKSDITPDASDELSLQEGWAFRSADGARHEIDLHWEVMNAPSLQALFSFTECAERRRPLPRLRDSAYGMDRPDLLIHTCLHRAMHITAPYFVDGNAYYGEDRLIWTYDVHLLAQALSDEEWGRFGARAHRMGVAAVCRRGLDASARRLGTGIPQSVRRKLDVEPAGEAASTYLLLNRQLARARRDLLAVRGLRKKWDFLWARAFPSAAFMRTKYPGWARLPLPLLYTRRALGLLGRRAPG